MFLSMRRPCAPERLYLDFDGFFAAVEQQLRPELRGRAVGVIPADTPHTCLIAASREAKARGVRGIVSVAEARRLAPDIALVVQRPDVYVKIHHRALRVVDTIAPVMAARSIDELVCDVAGWSRPEILQRANAIKQRLAATIGPYITCSIGIAGNELLAKIAAETRKPDGLVYFAPEEWPGPLLDLQLRDLPGIAGGLERRLLAAGITTTRALLNLAPKHARAIWRSVEGERFWAQLHGYDVQKPPTQKMMFGHSRVLAREWRNSERARACARLLTTKATRRMRREGFAASAFTLALRGKNDGGWAKTVRLVSPARDDHAFLKCLDEAWPRRWPEQVLNLSTTLHELSPAESGTSDLFETPEAVSTRARWLTISNTLDGINKRYGRALVSIGPRVDPPGGYAGAKIAFGRIPDLEDF
jgi:DNA polymerase-4